MAETCYRMLFDARPATAEELARVEEIVVEQSLGMAWEARIRLSLCVDDQGHWKHRGDEFAKPFSRVRIELQLGGGPFVPLMDGPVVSFDTAMDSQPGRSTATLVVHDDSVLLNRVEGVERFEDKTDEEVARATFAAFSELAPPRVEATGGAPRTVVRRGSAMRFLRELARRHRFHVYVLPGEVAGRSVPCFLPDSLEPATLPPFVLMGADRNLAEISVTEDAQRPQTTHASTLRLSDQQVVVSQRRISELLLMRAQPPLSDEQSAQRLLPPADNDAEDPAPRALAATRASSFAFRLSAHTVPGCYAAVLAPNRKVSVRAGDTPYSGDVLITRVTHRITASLYTQAFEARGDSKSDAAPAPPGAGGATGPSLSFSASLSVF